MRCRTSTRSISPRPAAIYVVRAPSKPFFSSSPGQEKNRHSVRPTAKNTIFATRSGTEADRTKGAEVVYPPQITSTHVLRPFYRRIPPVPAGHRLPNHSRSHSTSRGDRHGASRQRRAAPAGNPRPREEPVPPQLCPLRTDLDPGAVARGRKLDRRHAFRRRTRLLQHPHEGFCPCAQGLLLCGQDRRSPPPTRNRHVTAAEQPAGAARGGGVAKALCGGNVAGRLLRQATALRGEGRPRHAGLCLRRQPRQGRLALHFARRHRTCVHGARQIRQHGILCAEGAPPGRGEGDHRKYLPEMGHADRKRPPARGLCRCRGVLGTGIRIRPRTGPLFVDQDQGRNI